MVAYISVCEKEQETLHEHLVCSCFFPNPLSFIISLTSKHRLAFLIPPIQTQLTSLSIRRSRYHSVYTIIFSESYV